MLRVSEIYRSVQGEGPNVGSTTIFVRFGGCNLRCPGWPCDTPHAIDAALYRKEWTPYDPWAIAHQVFEAAGNALEFKVCFTGGEPFIQPTDDLKKLWEILQGTVGCTGVECFSNGTVRYPEWTRGRIQFIMDWKLPGSGEDPYNPVRLENVRGLTRMDSIKFTIADREDYLVAKQIWQDQVVLKKFTPTEFEGHIYYGVVWGKLENSELIGWVLEDGLPWKHNMQVHNIIWDRTQRGI